ncbi:MAG: hypothetical protein KDC24_01800 [Saprospiraceae bacterium]|nr:hypothetical protein [Saprospiraceae bacterium]
MRLYRQKEMANTLTRLIFLLFVSLQIQASNPIDWIEEENAAIALNNLTLYSDSSFSGRTVAFYKEKSLFKVIRKTASFYEDDAQKQLFRWFQVETPDHRIGWIFGNDLAVMEQAYRVPKTLKGYYKREKYFPNHFGNAKIWVASMEGKDLLSDRKRLKPSYREEYLIFTNRDLISDFILITTYNLYGASSLKEIQLKDITGNGTRDLVVETEYFETGTTKANRDVEIYSFQQNQLEKIFEESISLEMQGRKRSPCGFKHVSIQPQTIRVEYIDFTDCNKGSETISWQISSTQEYCVDFVTYTYTWNQDNQKFDLLYAPTRSKVSGRLIFPDTWMRDQPGNYGRRKLTLQYAEVVNVKELVSNDDTAQNDWFLIEIDNGDTGYIPANALMLRQTVHAGIINAYYNGQTQTNRKFVELENF